MPKDWDGQGTSGICCGPRLERGGWTADDIRGPHLRGDRAGEYGHEAERPRI